jgi:transcriptional antiterminator NusG
MSERAEWYVVHTYSGYENAVASTITRYLENREDLKNLIFEVRIPTETVIEPVKVKRKVVKQEELQPGTFVDVEETVEVTEKREVERKLLPGYVLVKLVLTDETWHIIRNIRGVAGFVGADLQETGMNGVPLSEEELRGLGINVDGEESAASPVTVELGYKVGDKVRIVGGPYANFTATVEEIDTELEKVHLSVFMFGRENPAEASLDQVEPIQED